tara:strand:+ start:5594 stop:5785 length:192 start_codon:yes stop_codon:yes gene_type:complete
MSEKTEDQILEERKVKALEKIGDSLDSLTLWFEEIDKDEWSERIAWYLDLWKQNYVDPLNKDE